MEVKAQEFIDDNKNSSIKIENAHGDVIGVGVSGFRYWADDWKEYCDRMVQ